MSVAKTSQTAYGDAGLNANINQSTAGGTSDTAGTSDAGNASDAGSEPEKAVDLIAKIKAATTVEDVEKLLSKDEPRTTVKDAAAKRIEELKK